MSRAPLPPNEDARLRALRQADALDTEPEESFDRLTDLAAEVCGTPMALITLVDADRQWFKSKVGLQVDETSRDVSMCAHTILEPDVLVVPDAREDERFADNPFVTGGPEIRFYAGSPLVTHDGQALGSLCVLDRVPRELDEQQIDALRTIAAHATSMLELRRTKELLEQRAEEWERAAGDREQRSEALAQLGDQLRRLIEAREQAEVSLRELERRFSSRAGDVPGRAAKVASLLGEIEEGAERLQGRLERESPLRAEALRIAACAAQARRLLDASGSA